MFMWVWQICTFYCRPQDTDKAVDNCFCQNLLLPQPFTLWCQLEDTFQLIVTPQGIEKVMIQLKDTPTKVYAIGAELFLSKVPLEVLQNWVLILLIVTPHILGKVQGQKNEVCQIIEPRFLNGTRGYSVDKCGVGLFGYGPAMNEDFSFIPLSNSSRDKS